MAAATATALALTPLTRTQALTILNKLEFLVAASNTLIPQNSVVTSEYEVSDGKRAYKFEPQPFCVLVRITRLEYLKALPAGMRKVQASNRYYYRIGTD